MGASGFAAITPLLAGDYTVVTHDPRGFARARLTTPIRMPNRTCWPTR